MKSFPNIEKSLIRHGQYRGWSKDGVRIFSITQDKFYTRRKSMFSWEAWETTTPFEAVYAHTLAELSEKLAAL